MGTGLAAGQNSPVQPVRSNLHAPTRNTRFCPPQSPLPLQANFGIIKYTPGRLHSRTFGPRALTCIDVDLIIIMVSLTWLA